MSTTQTTQVPSVQDLYKEFVRKQKIADSKIGVRIRCSQNAAKTVGILSSATVGDTIDANAVFAKLGKTKGMPHGFYDSERETSKEEQFLAVVLGWLKKESVRDIPMGDDKLMNRAEKESRIAAILAANKIGKKASKQGDDLSVNTWLVASLNAM